MLTLFYFIFVLSICDPTRMIVGHSQVTPSQAIVPFDPDLDKWKEELAQVKHNKLNESTRVQYLSANAVFVIFLMEHFPQLLMPPFLEMYRDMKAIEAKKLFVKGVKESLKMNTVCPVDLKKLQTDVFLTYLLSVKRGDGSFFSFSCYDGKRSALMHLVSESGSTFDARKKKELSDMLVGLKKTIAKENKDRGLRTIEGKEQMTLAVKLTCQLLVEDGSPESIFCLCFLTLQWNLISRSEATESISFQQMSWEDDHLKIFFARHKSDQVGMNKDEPRHVYSNPCMPVICPICALAAYCLAFPQVIIDGGKLFPGSDQKSRFGKSLHKTFVSNRDLYLSKHVDPEELGTHSIRKGAATYCCAGVHPGPPVVSVCLRAGWTIGRVKERYLKYESAGDELVGRTLTGIPPTSCEFGISPVYFIVSNETNPVLIESFLFMIFPIQKNTKLKCLTKQLLATIIYHEEWIADNSPSDGAVMNSGNFTYSVSFQDRRRMVRTSLPWENDRDSPNLTGIPIHCSMLNKLMEIHTMQRALPDKMMGMFIKELDERNMGGGMNASRILDAIAQSNEDLKKSLMEYVEKRTGVPNDESRSSASSSLFHLAAQATMRDSDAELATEGTKPTLMSEKHGVWAHFWEGKVNCLPRYFTFPSNRTLLSLWHSWHLPDIKNRICPYKSLTSNDVDHLRRGSTKLGEMKLVIDVLLSEVKKDDELFDTYIAGIQDIEKLTRVFEQAKQVFNNKRRKKRFGQLCWETFVKDARVLKLRSGSANQRTISSRRVKKRKFDSSDQSM